MEGVVGEGRIWRGGKEMETGSMVKKQERRRKECNRKPGGRKAGARRGEIGQGESGGRERKGVRMGESSGAVLSCTLLWLPLKAPWVLGCPILGVWRKKGSAFGQGGRERMAGNRLPLES